MIYKRANAKNGKDEERKAVLNMALNLNKSKER